MANKPVTPETIKPFTPPSPKDLDEVIRPEKLEAEELGDKILRDVAKTPVGYTVAVERLGSHGNVDGQDEAGPTAWTKDKRLTVKEVRDHFQGDPRTDELVARLVKLGALVPFFE